LRPNKVKNKYFVKRPKKFCIGQDIQPKSNLTLFVKWPRYIQLQQQRAILYKGKNVPPAITQFTQVLDRQTTTQLFKLVHKYRPETKQEKQQRLLAPAENKGDVPSKRTTCLPARVNTVTTLVENKKPQLVMTAHDVDPIKLVVFLPALCHKTGVPYCIAKGKAGWARPLSPSDNGALPKLVEAISTNFKDRCGEIHRHWGGNVLGLKSVTCLVKLEKAEAKELAIKLG
uniref:60S ribosomal protein L7a n=1 Tax=Otolemur garnettii TaxID=30611 RepID=H0Y215_OTOGA